MVAYIGTATRIPSLIMYDKFVVHVCVAAIEGDAKVSKHDALLECCGSKGAIASGQHRAITASIVLQNGCKVYNGHSRGKLSGGLVKILATT